ncbi:UNVERIFIED_CONTAM: hypothetical protein Sradi_2040500, partial [Sesamum radiatum]
MLRSVVDGLIGIEIYHHTGNALGAEKFDSKMKEKSWACTLITQLSLCIAAYVALNIGQPQKVTHGIISSVGGLTDMYFISVAGGFRPLEEQNLLLQQ